MNPITDTALDALGDRSRRTIVEMLAREPMAVGVLAERLPLSRPAVSQHLRILKEAGLVTDDSEGTRRVYRLSRPGFDNVRLYLDGLWTDVLDNFAILAESAAMAERPRTTRSRAGAHPVEQATRLIEGG